jgi:hypothetical protein
MRPCSFCGIPIILLNERETGGAMEWLLLKEKENREWNSRNMILLPE